MFALGIVSFVALGAALVLAGATQTHLAQSLGLDLAATGLLGAALSGGIGVGGLASGRLVDRRARRGPFVGASLLGSCALFGASVSSSFSGVAVGFAFCGLALGGYETVVAAAIAQRAGDRATRALAVLHAAATVGAFVGAPVLAALVEVGTWATPFRALGLGMGGIAIVGMFVDFPAPPRAVKRDASRPLGAAIAPLALIAACYVGIEGSLTVFAQPYAVAVHLDPERGVGAISAFWLGLLAGRIAIAVWPDVSPARTLAVTGLLAAAALGGGTLAGWRAVEAFWGLLGAVLGAVFPLLSARTVARFPASPGTALGVVLGAGAAGGFLIPWWTGALGDWIGARGALGALAFVAVLIAAAGAADRKVR